ncbi:MAG TPA: endo alpha-1,4 polygalactosaminidase, partial [Nitratifractor sp.]|nr:endo alpha-1,4 polygalactosaminidase [Nitratifractor sp.]
MDSALLSIITSFILNNESKIFDPNINPITNGSWYKPIPGTSWQWQLQGTINTAYNVDIYDIDLFDSSQELRKELKESGKKVICYFSAGSYENWRDDKSKFSKSLLGNPLDGWAGER